MTEFLNDSAPLTNSTALKLTLFPAPEVPESSAGRVRVGRSGAIDIGQLTAWVSSGQDRDAVPADKKLTAAEVAALPARRLRMQLNQMYTLMEADYPPTGAVDQYRVLVDELERRAEAAESRGVATPSREKFRDNPLYCRFELFIDGVLAAYIEYRMDGGNLTLTKGAEVPGFRDHGADERLMRNIVLDAHKRRLKLIPRCPMSYAFLADNPQYQRFTNHH